MQQLRSDTSQSCVAHSILESCLLESWEEAKSRETSIKEPCERRPYQKQYTILLPSSQNTAKMLLRAAVFWTIAAEHCCIFEKLCKSASVPKRNKMWVGRAHEVSVHKEKRKKGKHFTKMPSFDCLCRRGAHLKIKKQVFRESTHQICSKGRLSTPGTLLRSQFSFYYSWAFLEVF